MHTAYQLFLRLCGLSGCVIFLKKEALVLALVQGYIVYRGGEDRAHPQSGSGGRWELVLCLLALSIQSGSPVHGDVNHLCLGWLFLHQTTHLGIPSQACLVVYLPDSV